MTREAAQVSLPACFETVLRVQQGLLRRFAQQSDLRKCGEDFALAFCPDTHVGNEFSMRAR